MHFMGFETDLPNDFIARGRRRPFLPTYSVEYFVWGITFA